MEVHRTWWRSWQNHEGYPRPLSGVTARLLVLLADVDEEPVDDKDGGVVVRVQYAELRPLPAHHHEDGVEKVEDLGAVEHPQHAGQARFRLCTQAHGHTGTRARTGRHGQADTRTRNGTVKVPSWPGPRPRTHPHYVVYISDRACLYAMCIPPQLRGGRGGCQQPQRGAGSVGTRPTTTTHPHTHTHLHTYTPRTCQLAAGRRHACGPRAPCQRQSAGNLAPGTGKKREGPTGRGSI